MSNFRRTSEALHDWQANVAASFGSHIDPVITTGVPSNVIVGEAEFNPFAHDPYDIDHMSLMSIATDTPHVREEMPDRPLRAHILIDRTNRGEHPQLTRAKTGVASNLEAALNLALPGISDSSTTTTLVSESASRRILPGYEVKATSKTNIIRLLGQMGTKDIKVVISDFENLLCDENLLRQMGPTLAIKLNHPLQRHIASGMGPIDLYGGEKSVDTNNKKSLAKENQILEERHQQIISLIARSGAEPVNILSDHRQAAGYNVIEADKLIASAVKAIQKKRKH